MNYVYVVIAEDMSDHHKSVVGVYADESAAVCEAERQCDDEWMIEGYVIREELQGA